MSYVPKKFALLVSSLTVAAAVMAIPLSFDTYFVELDTSKMVSTGDTNYAICDQNLPANWRSVSVNGDEMRIATRENKELTKRYSTLTADERRGLESIRNTLSSVIRLGPFNVKSQTGFSKLTTFDRNGGTSTMGSGGAASSSSSSASSSGGNGNGAMSVSKTGPNSFIVSKGNFELDWQRVFVNENVVTIVYKTGKVVMLPQELMAPNERQKMVELRKEVESSSNAAEKMAKSFASGAFGGSPLDFVNRALGGMFG